MRTTSMTKKAKDRAPAALRFAPLTPPWTLEERVHGIEAMAQRIASYIRFICDIDTLNGASAEVKERAVTAFYEQMVIVESQLGRIHDQLQLE